MRKISVILAVLFACSTNSFAATLWNEAVNGTLSANRLAPSAFTLATGDNDILGIIQGGKVDYVTLTVPANTTLSKLILESYVSTAQKAFFGIQQGSTFTEPTSGTNVAHLLG